MPLVGEIGSRISYNNNLAKSVKVPKYVVAQDEFDKRFPQFWFVISRKVHRWWFRILPLRHEQTQSTLTNLWPHYNPT